MKFWFQFCWPVLKRNVFKQVRSSPAGSSKYWTTRTWSLYRRSIGMSKWITYYIKGNFNFSSFLLYLDTRKRTFTYYNEVWNRSDSVTILGQRCELAHRGSNGSLAVTDTLNITTEENVPIIVAALSTAWKVFASSSTGIVGSNPTRRGMDVCLRLFCVCVVLCRWQIWVGLIPSPTDCLQDSQFQN
jgi:hypothetical protein